METTSSNPPRWYWIVSGLACLWMAFGVFAWFMDPAIVQSNIEQFTGAHRDVIEARPMWLFVLYGIAVFSGFIGTIGLLMRKSWATTAFWLSLVTAAIQFGFSFFMLDAIRLLGAATVLPFPLVILAIGTFLLWFSMHARKQGWIRG